MRWTAMPSGTWQLTRPQGGGPAGGGAWQELEERLSDPLHAVPRTDDDDAIIVVLRAFLELTHAAR
jgi:hypothetical protein